jgi:hypothetical protein
MFSEKELLELDELLYFMNILENIKKGTTKKGSLKNPKTIFFLENCIEEIIERCNTLLLKFKDTKDCSHLITKNILGSINNYWVKNGTTLSCHKLYHYSSETKTYDQIYKYPKNILWELSNYILFFKNEIQKITGLNNPYYKDGIETLLEMYNGHLEELSYDSEEFSDILNEKKKEYLKLKKSLLFEEKTAKKEISKFISDYKYPITSKSSVWTIKNK